MCWWANMRVRRETWPSTCLQLNRLQIKCSILRCCACTWRMTSERGSQWLGLLFARMQMRLQVRRTWRGAQIHQFTFHWQIWRRKTRKQWDWHATNQSRIPRCSSWTPTPITTSEKIFGVLCIRRRQSTSICSLWHPHMAVWKTTVLCLELLSTSHRPAECCRGWCLISILWNSYWYGQACCDGMCNICAMCDTELVAEADSFQFDSLTSERSHVSQLHGSLISKQLPHSLDKTELSIACDEFLVLFRGRCVRLSTDSVTPRIRSWCGLPPGLQSRSLLHWESPCMLLLTNDVEAQGVAMMDTGRSLVR